MEIDGTEFTRLAADLAGAGARASKPAHTVVVKTAADIQRDAKAYCPVDTGNLRASIRRQTKGLEAEIGPTANYGHYVEFGTSRMGPQPYMGPALDRNAPLFEQALAQIIGEVL